MEATKQYLWHLFWPNSADEELRTEKQDRTGTGRKAGVISDGRFWNSFNLEMYVHI